MFLRQLSIGAPADNTCRWRPDATAFKTWAKRGGVGTHAGLLQIIGKPGSGKSVLMKSVFEATRLRPGTDFDGACVMGHFFNRLGRAVEHNALGMLHSILYQLGTFHPACLGAFAEYCRADLQLLKSESLSSYVDLLKDSLKRIFSDPTLSPERTILFVDALDECDQREEVGYFLADLTRLACTRRVQLDICFSRRDYPSITVRDCLAIRIEAHSFQDIKQYIKQKMEIADVGAQEAEVLQDAVAKRSNGIFLWAVLAVEGILKDVESGKNIKHILEHTDSLPRALEDLFAQILEHTDSLPRALEDLFAQILEETGHEDLKITLRLLQWAVLPADRLRVREWHHILAFLLGKPPASLKEWKESCHYTSTDAQLERRIRYISRGLVEVKGGVSRDVDEVAVSDTASLLAGAGSLDNTEGDSRVVQPIHETLVRFLASERANELFKQCLHPDTDLAGEGHPAIASTCLDYIGIAELQDLVTARQRQKRPNSRALDDDTGNPMSGTKGVIEQRRVREWRQRRDSSSSTTSFMSSASSHFTGYLPEKAKGGHETVMSTADSHHINTVADTRIHVAYTQPKAKPKTESHPPGPFSALFPTGLCYTIRHGESAPGENMALRVDVGPTQGRKEPYRIFDLQMHSLPQARVRAVPSLLWLRRSSLHFEAGLPRPDQANGASGSGNPANKHHSSRISQLRSSRARVRGS